MNIDIVFDGGNGASKEKEAYGSFQLTLPDHDVTGRIHRKSFGAGFTNNEAEYKTLIAALEYISVTYAPEITVLHIRGDSELVRNQIGSYIVYNGKLDWIDVWKVKKKHLIQYRDKARELLEQFKNFTYDHIPREEVVRILGH